MADVTQMLSTAVERCDLFSQKMCRSRVGTGSCDYRGSTVNKVSVWPDGVNDCLVNEFFLAMKPFVSNVIVFKGRIRTGFRPFAQRNEQLNESERG